MNATLANTPTPLAVIDLLNGLLEAEYGSLFRCMGQQVPYLGSASPALRKSLARMVSDTERRIAELAGAIADLGGDPVASSPCREEQYLGYLSIKFLIPKLAQTTRLAIARYESAIAALRDASPAVRCLLEVHLAQHREDLAALA